MKNKLKKSVFLLSSLMMLSVGVGFANGVENTVNVAEAAVVEESFSFKSSTSSSDSSTALTTSKKITDIFSDGSYDDYFSKISATSYVYNGKSGYGLKFSSSSKAGSLTLELKNSLFIKSITVEACKFKSSEAASFSVNGSTAKSLTNSFANYKFELDGSSISSIKFDATKRAYLKSLSFEFDDGTGDGESFDYYVCFYDENGDEIRTVGTNGEPVESFTMTAEPGYKFAGWFENNATEAYDFTAQVERDVELYPRFEKLNEAYLLIDTGEHGTYSIEEVESFDLKYTLPELDSVEDGWRFVGWYNEDDEFLGLPGSTITFEEGYEGIISAWYEEIPEGQVVDTLDNKFAGGNTTSSYKDWSNVGASGAAYVGQSAGQNSTIQLRSNNSNSGIVTKVSAGYARNVTVEWHSSTANGRTLQVYGKSSSYSAATELYDSSTQGTLIGTIVCGTSVSLDITGDYEYIGLRSSSSAMYLNSIDITWEPIVSDTYDVTLDAGDGAFNDGVTTEYTFDAGTENEITLPSANDVTYPWSDLTTANVKWYVNGEAFECGATVTVDSKTTISARYEYNPVTLTVAEALAVCERTGTTNTPFDVTIKGTVSEIKDAYSSQYKNISFYITDDSTETAFLCYRVSGGEDLVVGEEVAVTGKLVNYNSNTPEFTAGCTYVSFSAKSAINYQYDNDEAPTAVRFIGTLTNVNAETVESVTLSFVKDGVAANKEVELYTLYTSVADTFVAADNTYYVVYILNGVQNVLNQELSVTMTVTFNNGAEDLVATRTFTLGA